MESVQLMEQVLITKALCNLVEYLLIYDRVALDALCTADVQLFVFFQVVIV